MLRSYFDRKRRIHTQKVCKFSHLFSIVLLTVVFFLAFPTHSVPKVNKG